MSSPTVTVTVDVVIIPKFRDVAVILARWVFEISVSSHGVWRNNVLVLEDNKIARRLMYPYHIMWNWQCCCPVPTRANPRSPSDSPPAPGQWVITLSKHCKNLAPDCGNWFKFTIFYGQIIFLDRKCDFHGLSAWEWIFRANVKGNFIRWWILV